MACIKLFLIITLISNSSTMFCKEKEFGYKCCSNYYWDLTGGKCKECEPGSIGLDCSFNCSEGYYGRLCLSKCQENCTSCDNVNGTCYEVNTENLDDQTTISLNIVMVTSRTPLRQPKAGLLRYIVISIGSSAVLALLAALMKNIYTMTTREPNRTILLQIQDPESEAAQNTVNPAFDPIYENSS